MGSSGQALQHHPPAPPQRVEEDPRDQLSASGVFHNVVLKHKNKHALLKNLITVALIEIVKVLPPLSEFLSHLINVFLQFAS